MARHDAADGCRSGAVQPQADLRTACGRGGRDVKSCVPRLCLWRRRGKGVTGARLYVRADGRDDSDRIGVNRYRRDGSAGAPRLHQCGERFWVGSHR
jgi:hypothetical protein